MTGLLLMAAMLSAQCGTAVDTTFLIPEGARIEFVDPNLDLEIRARPAHSAVATATGTLPDGTCLELSIAGGVHSLRIRRVKDRMRSRAEIILEVPAATAVKVGVTDGSVRISGLHGGVSVTTVYAPIAARNLRGEIQLRAVEADVTADSLEGTVYLRSTARDVHASSIGGDLTIESVGGRMRVTGAMPRTITSSTWGGTIEVDGLPPAGGKFQLATHSGDVRITLPKSGNAVFEVTTWEALVRSTIPLSQMLKKGEIRRGVVGTGGALVEISSVQGRIVITSRVE
jgi:DUF4097 and DUF4098 domain-containing protein YvlB